MQSQGFRTYRALQKPGLLQGVDYCGWLPRGSTTKSKQPNTNEQLKR